MHPICPYPIYTLQYLYNIFNNYKVLGVQEVRQTDTEAKFQNQIFTSVLNTKSVSKYTYPKDNFNKEMYKFVIINSCII